MSTTSVTIRPTTVDRGLGLLALPLGLANPLWLAFGAAAGVGAGWWLLTRWSRPAKMAASAPAHLPRLEQVRPAVIEASAIAEPRVLAAPEPSPLIPAAAEAEPAAATVNEPTRDDLTLLTGVGPRTAQALAAKGVTRFADLAAWTSEQLAAFDAEFKLKGRSRRDAWIEQAARLASEKHPSS